MRKNLFIFNKFLKNEECLDLFLSNFRTRQAQNSRRSWDRPAELEVYLETTEPFLYINDSFSWEGTREGYAFWQNKSDKWQKSKREFIAELNMLTKTL